MARDIIGVFIAVLVLAGLTVAIVNGGLTAQVLQAIGNSFATIVNSATNIRPASNA